MEVLNQNQRRSAIWRLTGIGVIIIVLVGLSILSMHNAYARAGVDDIEQLKQEHQQAMQVLLAQVQDLKSEKRQLKAENKKLKSQLSDPDEVQKIMQLRLDQKDDRIDDLERDLKSVKADLAEKESKLAACESEK